MDVQEVQEYLVTLADAVSNQFQKIPGSAIFLRYVQSSYQNDPVRSAVELFSRNFRRQVSACSQVLDEAELREAIRRGRFLFRKQRRWLTVPQEIDDLVEDWTPEPLVPKSTSFEEADIEKRPVIVGSVQYLRPAYSHLIISIEQQDHAPSSPVAAPSRT